MTDNSASIGSKIRTARKAHGWTQEALGEKIGVTKATVSRWEKGEDVPQGRHLSKLTTVLEMAADWFTEDRDEQPKAVKEEPRSYPRAVKSPTSEERKIGTALAWPLILLRRDSPSRFRAVAEVIRSVRDLAPEERALLKDLDFLLIKGGKR